MEQVDATVRDLVNAVILRSVQDFMLQSLNLPGSYTEGSKGKIKNEAYNFLVSQDCQYMCECIGIEYKSILKTIGIKSKER